MTPIISLLTDFGPEGQHYVASMKGVILSINPNLTIVDLTHAISSYSIIEAQYIISTTQDYFPKGTVFIIVVDPGVGSSRDILVLETIHKKYFIGPNNGIFTSIPRTDVSCCVRAQNEIYFHHPVSKTFHGRDIMAPLGAHLTKNVPLEDLGPPLDEKQVVRLPLTLQIDEEQERIRCIVQHIDSFGNITTNVRLTESNHVENSYLLIKEKSNLSVIHDNDVYEAQFSTHYEELRKEEMLFLKGSTNFLEISKNQANAARDLKIKIGEVIEIVL